jgi:putative membrane protein (TIGR04086 family)
VSGVDVRAVLVGAAVALVLVVPVVVIARLIVGDDDVASPWPFIFAAYVLGATVFGTAIAGRRAPDAPLLHGALAGLVTFVVAQLISSVARADFPNVVAFIFFAIAFMCLGAIGGFAASAVTSRRRRDGKATGATP